MVFYEIPRGFDHCYVQNSDNAPPILETWGILHKIPRDITWFKV
jgi:hypothetical protein